MRLSTFCSLRRDQEQYEKFMYYSQIEVGNITSKYSSRQKSWPVIHKFNEKSYKQCQICLLLASWLLCIEA